MKKAGKLSIKARVINKLTYNKMLFHNFTGCLTVMYKQDLNNKIYGPSIKVNNDYALFLQVLKRVKNACGYHECLSQYRIRQNSLSKNNKDKITSFMKIMMNIEEKNIFIALLYLISNRLIKIMWKYQKINSKK